jgi:tRNA pseudouridine38-40 synthase
MVGTLLEIGRGEFSLDELEQSFVSNELPEFITPAYPQGLYLSKVNYRYLDIPSRTDFSFLQNIESDWVAI